MILDECICFVNGTGGDAHIVLGVSDKEAGSAAFSGTTADVDELERHVFNRTVPNLRVEASEFLYNETRLLLIRIPSGLAVYSRKSGAASHRVGTDCLPMGEEERHALFLARRNPDVTSRIADVSLSELDPVAIEQARRYLSEKRLAAGDVSAVPNDPLRLLGEIGLLTRDGKLTLAAQILFGRPSPEDVIVRFLYREFPGAEPISVEESGPLLLAFPQIQELVRRYSDPEIARVHLPGGQEAAIAAFPSTAVDEVISNAMVHRDWMLSQPVVVDLRPRLLSVWSPGSLPYGVEKNRLLTTQSVPRNPTLMKGMRALGLVEESSRGFDRMWLSMITSGRHEPLVVADDMHVEVSISAGPPDLDFVRSLSSLQNDFGRAVVKSVDAMILVRHLANAPLITLRQAEDKMQANRLHAQTAMSWLVDIGVIQTVSDRSDEWVLTSAARRALGPAAKAPIASVSVQEWIEERLLSDGEVRNRDVVEATGADSKEVSATLSHLQRLGRAVKDPDGPSRGPSVRWISPRPNTRPAK